METPADWDCPQAPTEAGSPTWAYALELTRVFNEHYFSHVLLERPNHIHVRYLNGPFRYLNNHWRFAPHPQGTEVQFFVDFEFRSRLLQAVIGTVFNEAVRLMVRAFERRAMRLYGRNQAPPSAAPQATPGAAG